MVFSVLAVREARFHVRHSRQIECEVNSRYMNVDGAQGLDAAFPLKRLGREIGAIGEIENGFGLFTVR